MPWMSKDIHKQKKGLAKLARPGMGYKSKEGLLCHKIGISPHSVFRDVQSFSFLINGSS